MRSLLVASLVLVLIVAAPSPAADQKVIDATVKKGVAYLEGEFRNSKPGGKGEDGIGPVALAGLALLESGKPADNPTVKAIAAAVRDSAYPETRTYHLALSLLFLDRLGDPNDVPRIQMLAVKLLAGQTAHGGWTYSCIDDVSKEQESWLRANVNEPWDETKNPKALSKDSKLPKDVVIGKFHPGVFRYAIVLAANRGKRMDSPGDNSNTQFGLLGLWVARKHHVPVEAALAGVENRFVFTQNDKGGWPYSGKDEGSASMTCAGLLGLATAVARREERLKMEALKKADLAKSADADPFFTPPSNLKVDPRPFILENCIRKAHDKLVADLGDRGGRKWEAYFLWSLERVGVVYGVDKIGKFDWFEYGINILLPAQRADGSWVLGHKSEVDTSFAILFLVRSNLVRDLTMKAKEKDIELRSGSGTPSPPAPIPAPKAKTDSKDEAAKMAEALVNSPADSWTKTLEELRDGKGSDFTKALVRAVVRLDGERKKQVREVLAERLTRMSAETLRAMLKEDEAELRRAAALACAMKDDKAHVLDLIERLATDDEEIVVLAARAGLKSLSEGQDFGPDRGASKANRALAAEEWKVWWAKQKK